MNILMYEYVLKSWYICNCVYYPLCLALWPWIPLTLKRPSWRSEQMFKTSKLIAFNVELRP